MTAIVGIGVVALLQLLAAGSMANGQSTELTTAVFLANNVNEMMQGKPFEDLHADYDNKTYSPPRDAREQPLAGFDGWSQVIDLEYVDPDMLTVAVPQEEDAARVTVRIVRNGRVVHSIRWIVAK